MRAAILSEPDLPVQSTPHFDGIFRLAQFSIDQMFAIGDPPDHEPTAEMSVAGIARRRGGDPLATMYELMLESNATAMLMLPFFNYTDGNHDAIYDMIAHPAAVSGLSDGGRTAG
ncbi:MAG: N-acyl-D-amino-acid deacylase [Mycobacterium sp.]|nr:N-acyl-D-amino-acid deacylase [Mycobacterium sp.]